MLLKIFFLLAIAIKKSQTNIYRVSIPEVIKEQSQKSCNIEFGLNINYSGSSKQKIAPIINIKTRKASKIDSIVLCDNFMKNENGQIVSKTELDKAPIIYFHEYAFKCNPGEFKTIPYYEKGLDIINLAVSEVNITNTKIYKKEINGKPSNTIQLGSNDCGDLKYIYYLYPVQDENKKSTSINKQIAFFFNGAPEIWKIDFNPHDKFYSLNDKILNRLHDPKDIKKDNDQNQIHKESQFNQTISNTNITHDSQQNSQVSNKPQNNNEGNLSEKEKNQNPVIL